MTAGKMHADEVDTDLPLVARLLAAQFPQWAGLSLAPVPSAGTDHALYRLGSDMVVRLPRIGWATGQADKEFRWLPVLAPHLPLTVPTPLVIGAPGEGYPFRWSVYRWLPGKNATVGSIADWHAAATTLAGFVAALQRIDPAGGPPPAGRGGPLVERDEAVRAAIAALGKRVDANAATTAWEVSLHAPVYNGPSVWLHGDLLPGNLLVVGGKLSAVIDFGGLSVGDPACDLQPAWNPLPADVRSVFRAALAVDDATWARGRGWALSQALIALPYYWDTNPGMVAMARRTLGAVLAGDAHGA